MPCLELKVAAQSLPQPATRLRTLLEKPGAAVLRRNHIAEASGPDEAVLRNRIRVAAVLAVDLTDPPRESDAPPPAENQEQQQEAPPPEQPKSESLNTSFAKGLEIWIADGARNVCIVADEDEIPGVLSMFDAWLRLARYQPAFQRLDQRIVGLNYAFREGLTVGIQGNPSEHPPMPDSFFTSIAAIPEIGDSRDPRFLTRLPNTGIAFVHDLFRSASGWLDENSFPNILGGK